MKILSKQGLIQARDPSLLEISSMTAGNLEIWNRNLVEIYIRIVKFGVEIYCCLRESLL